jgi:FG-GAP-like repeat/WG containing repeat
LRDYNAYETPFVTLASKIIGVISAGAVLLATTGCGGGSNPGSGGGSGSGGSAGSSGNGPQITVISPSMVMSDIAIGAFTIIGSGFTQASQVLIDGKPPAFPILLEDSEDIEVYLLGAPVLGVYQITVTNGSQVSNSSPFTYYYPSPAPAGLFQAFPGYYAEPSFLISQAVVADFNGDGRADVMVNSSAMGGNYPTMALLLGQSDGSLATPQYVSNVVGNAAGDVDGNGTIDLVGLLAGTDGGEQCSVYLNDGHANFTPGPSCPAIPVFPDISTALIDVNADGLPDLVVAGQYSPIVVLLNQGGGNFGQPIMTGVSTGNDWKIIVADFSGNGLPDIAYNTAVATGVEQVHLLLNQGNGVFNDMIPSGLQGVGGVLTAGDFNLDGIQDLIVQTVTTSQTINLQVFLGQGRNAFTLASTITLDPVPLATYQFAVGDFDHDGLPDLVGMTSPTIPNNSLWGFIDTSGKVVITPQYPEASAFSEGLAAICTGDCGPKATKPHSRGYIDRDGKVVIPTQFGAASNFSEGLAQVCVGSCEYVEGSGYNGKFGFIDRSGRFVINPQYDNVLDFKNGFAKVFIGNGTESKSGYIDKTGKTIWQPSN